MTVKGQCNNRVGGNVDLTVELEAPAHVASGSTFLVRIAYYKLGSQRPPDAQVTAKLPADSPAVDSVPAPVTGNTEFALDLDGTLFDGDDNLFLSSYSLSAANQSSRD